MYNDENKEEKREEKRIACIVQHMLEGQTHPIYGLRLLLPYRDFFGDIRHPISNSITGIESQTDHLIFEKDNLTLINKHTLSKEDLDYFTDAAVEIAQSILTYLKDMTE